MITNEMKQYARYLLKSNKRLCIVIWVAFFVVIPFLMISTGDINSDSLALYTLFIGFALACLTPIYLFRFIYQKRSSDLYFSLPIKRTQLFYVTFFTGFLTILLPVLVNITIAMFFVLFGGVTYLSNIFMFMIISIMTMFSLYAIVTWAVQHCNNLLDSIFISGCYIFLPVLFIGAFSIFLQNQFSVFMVGSGDFSNNIQGFTIIARGISIIFSFFQSGFIPNLIHGGDVLTSGYWLLIALVCMWFANKRFMKRKQEDSEQRTTAWWTYPLIIGLLTFCLILMIVNLNMSIDIIIITSIAIFILYICMVFFSKRRIKLTFRTIFLFAVLYTGTFGFSYLFQTTKGFGMVQEVPDVSEIERVSIDFYYMGNPEKPLTVNFMKDKKETKIQLTYLNGESDNIKDIKEIMKVQEKLIQQKEEGYNDNQISFIYFLRNGKSIYRYYKVSEKTMIEQIQAIFTSNANGNSTYKLNYDQIEK